MNGDGDQDVFDDDVQLLHVQLQQQETAERGGHEDDGSKHGQESFALVQTLTDYPGCVLPYKGIGAVAIHDGKLILFFKINYEIK